MISLISMFWRTKQASKIEDDVKDLADEVAGAVNKGVEEVRSEMEKVIKTEES